MPLNLSLYIREVFECRQSLLLKKAVNFRPPTHAGTSGPAPECNPDSVLGAYIKHRKVDRALVCFKNMTSNKPPLPG